MDISLAKTVGEIVAADYRKAQIFKNHKIDFCCKGNRTLQEVAEKHKVNADQLLQELRQEEVQEAGEPIDFKSWPLDLLTDYIEKKHHRYVERQIPVLRQYLAKLCRVHGERHPELHEIEEHFSISSGELAMHMKKEELVLFPFIRKMAEAKQLSKPLSHPHFGTVQNPIRSMMQEHENEGERFRKISDLSNSYTPPADACTTYRVTYSLLREFEKDLHLHIHLENNILFPKSAELEKTMTSSNRNQEVK